MSSLSLRRRVEVATEVFQNGDDNEMDEHAHDTMMRPNVRVIL